MRRQLAAPGHREGAGWPGGSYFSHTEESGEETERDAKIKCEDDTQVQGQKIKSLTHDLCGLGKLTFPSWALVFLF